MRTLSQHIQAQYQTLQTLYDLMNKLWRGEIQGFGVRRVERGFTVTVEMSDVKGKKAA